jgi:predicted dehydrogenase
MIKLGIVGTGGMANSHADAFQKIPGVKIVAASDVSEERVQAFGKKYNIPHLFTDTETMFDAVPLDAIANVTSDAFHAPISLAAIQRGLHVLCEKPLATNYPDAKKMAEAARKKGVVNLVQFSYRRSSAWVKAVELVQSGKLGEITHFEASYLQSWLVSDAWGDWKTSPIWLWRLSQKHGSKGVLGDVGVHIIDFTTAVAGPLADVNCRLKTFTSIKGKKIGEYPLDANDSAVIHAQLKSGGVGVIHTTRFATGKANSIFLRVHGTKGALEIDLDKSWTDLQVCLGKDVRPSQWKTLKCPPAPSMFQRFIRSIKTGKNDQPDFARGAEVQKVLDLCFESDRLQKTVRV